GLRYRRWWPETLRRAGLPTTIWFRDLRAVAASMLQRVAGLSLTDTQRLLGHSSPLVTAQHYHVPHPDIARRFHALRLPGLPADAGSKTEKSEPTGQSESPESPHRARGA